MNRNSNDASSSTTAPGSTYEVFLSFRGPDIRLGFTDHLYCNLTNAGIRTFRDDKELPPGKKFGPELIKAIDESSISIPILSKEYASSKWCLMELTHMVKRMNEDPEGRRPKHTVYPIFYGVTPSEVRHQAGSFEEAFVKYTNDKEVDIQKWKDALKEVCKLTGREKDNIANGYEGQLVDIIVTEVCMMLKKRNVHLTGNLVGIKHHWEEMTKLLDIKNCDGARIVGIIGMGGIGKTTIAKYTYNQLCDHFQQQCSFLEDVRENVMLKGRAELQRKLISEVLKRPADKTTLDISNAFSRKKVLIVLDDVENRAQLTEIIGSLAYFDSGSRIIVTTRNKDVFIESKGDLIYEPSGMDDYNSLLLFCKHAFESTKPREGFEKISREVAETAAGLPLSLRVIGSMLFEKTIEKWKHTLNKLRNIPADEVQNRLKISYDTLTHNQQEMFLDIACHFIEEDKTKPIYMWDACGFHPEACGGIDVLVSRCLITIERRLAFQGDEDVFRMHDQLRDMGREIFYQENSNALVQRSRLWSREEAVATLMKKSGTNIVQTLSVNYRQWDRIRDSDSIFSNEHFKGLSSLRYLSLEGPRLKGDFNGLVSNLKWFRWKFGETGGVLDIMSITNVCAKELVILDLSRSGITDGWENAIKIKAASNLKVLNLFGCRYLTKLPECLWNMKSLVELDLSYTLIKRLPDVIGKLEKLEVLNCSECKSLEGHLPEGIGRLSSLRVLNLSFTLIDTLPEDVGGLRNLRELNLSGTHIKKLPGVGIERLQKLEVLSCSHTLLEGELPEEIWRLFSLRVLKLSHSKITGGLPNDISGLSNLKTLELGFYKKIQWPVEGLKLPLGLTKLAIDII